MQWLECTVPGGDDPEELCSALAELGVGGMSIENERDFHDFLENNRACWDYVDEALEESFSGVSRVKFWLSCDAEGESVLAAVRAAGYSVETRVIADEDWENNWKQYFKPFRVGETFLIKPSWEQCEPEEGRRILEIDPSSSFGTGTHNTTQLCICELERLVKSGDRLLDMGCGSGILSVAAHMLGAEDVTAVDIDPNAVRIAAENAEKNGFALHTGVGDVIGNAELSARIGGDYDIIVANIVADVIMGMQDILKSKLKREGTLIVSGIIAPRADEVQASLLGAGFVLDRRDQSGDWVAMTLHQA